MEKELFEFTPAKWSDHELAMYLRSKDKDWTWEKINEGEIAWNRYRAHGKIVAIVKYKNSAPIGRWIWVPITEITHHISNGGKYADL